MDATANKPTVLAKLLGFYTVEIRNLETGTTQAKADLLVMENLFYDRRFSKIYDLKGSTRNRHVRSTGRENEVLLDENLVESELRHIFAEIAWSNSCIYYSRTSCAFLLARALKTNSSWRPLQR